MRRRYSMKRRAPARRRARAPRPLPPPAQASGRSCRELDAGAAARHRSQPILAHEVIDMGEPFAEGEAHLMRIVDDAPEHYGDQIRRRARRASARGLDGDTARLVVRAKLVDAGTQAD